MPSILGFNNATSSRGAEALSAQNSQVQSVRAEAPWQGYTPDLDVAHLGPSASRDIEGLTARADTGGSGEILTNFPGYGHIDSTYADSTGGKLGDNTGTANDIVGLAFFARTNATGNIAGEFDDTTIAISAGNHTTEDSCQVWRVRPSTGLWQEITKGGGGSPAQKGLSGGYPASGQTTQLWNFAAFPASATPRTALTDVTAGEPVLVFTNNHDPVQIYSVQNSGDSNSAENGFYEALTEAFGTGTSAFKCRSVANWRGRMHYFNTVENGARNRQRLRRSAIGNADPDTTNDGSGATDLLDFQGDGLRVEGLGNVLAMYFEDGVAFARAQTQGLGVYQIQTITKERGLLSTHALADLGGGVHFGLFTDGWFFLSQNGQFQEAGVSQVGGSISPKWRRTFFQRLDKSRRDQIDVRYDPDNRTIVMTLPLDSGTSNQEVWVYDFEAGRVFTRKIAVTKWGSTNLQLSSGETIGSLGGTIGSLGGTIGSFGPVFSLENLIHGTSGGMVVAHDPDLTTIINAETGAELTESWKYTTVLSGLGSPRTHKAVSEIVIELVRLAEGSFQVQLLANAGDTGQSRTFDVPAGNNGDVLTLTRPFRYSAAQISMQLSGNLQVGFRSFEIDIRDTGSRVRETF